MGRLSEFLTKMPMPFGGNKVDQQNAHLEKHQLNLILQATLKPPQLAALQEVCHEGAGALEASAITAQAILS